MGRAGKGKNGIHAHPTNAAQANVRDEKGTAHAESVALHGIDDFFFLPFFVYIETFYAGK